MGCCPSTLRDSFSRLVSVAGICICVLAFAAPQLNWCHVLDRLLSLPCLLGIVD